MQWGARIEARDDGVEWTPSAPNRPPLLWVLGLLLVGFVAWMVSVDRLFVVGPAAIGLVQFLRNPTRVRVDAGGVQVRRLAWPPTVVPWQAMTWISDEAGIWGLTAIGRRRRPRVWLPREFSQAQLVRIRDREHA